MPKTNKSKKYYRRKTHKNKSKSKLKLKHTNIYSQRRNKGGGNEIDLRQIFITQPIIDAVMASGRYNGDIKQFKVSSRNAGFGLSRMEDMIQADFDDLLSREPVELIKAKNQHGKSIGIPIPNQPKLKQAYEIVNGRHRIARAIIDGRQTINAKIIEPEP